MNSDTVHADPDERAAGELAVVGDQDGREVSLQLLQSVYNEVTGKTEELNKGYDLAFRVGMDDLQQLHYRIKQLCEQYNICSENESVTIYHEEDSRQVFSSFDRFKIGDPTSLSPVESVLLRYNFLVVLPKTRRPQSYSLSIRLASRITVIRKMREEMAPQFVLMMSMRTAMVTVQYVDYVVARNLLDGVDQWVRGLPAHEFPEWFSAVRKRSSIARSVARYSLGAVGVYLVARAIPVYITSSNPDFQTLAYFALSSWLSMFLLFRAGRFLGMQVERALDETVEISYINLNRGDQRRIDEANRARRWTAARGIVGAAGTVALGIISNYVAAWLTSPSG